jgi:hypothetical protein
VPGGKKERKKHTDAEAVFCLVVHRGEEYQQSITSKETHDIGTPFVPKIGWKEKLVTGVLLVKWIGP